MSARGRPSTRRRAEPALVRGATVLDARRIHRLVTSHAAEGRLLPRTLSEITNHADRFLVATVSGRIVGCAELAPLSSALVEIRSFVVATGCRGRGVGRGLISELRTRARRRGFDQMCAFTHAPFYFLRHEFAIVPRTSLPEKIATDCRRCALSGCCGQSAMVLNLELAADTAPLGPGQHAPQPL